jgi:hypothetical protein
MIHRQRTPRSVSWAWAAGWFLASVGLVLSDVSSSLNRGLAAAYVLGSAGWASGGLVAVVVGLRWSEEWHAGFMGPIVAGALGGAIGGALTLPMHSLSSPATVLRRSLSGAVRWGAAFLVLKVLAFYVGYILVEMTVDPLVSIVGHTAAKILGWAVPAGLGGFIAARLAGMFPPSSESSVTGLGET